MFGGGEEYGEEEEEDYQYHNWGVDRVDLDFKSGHHRFYKQSFSATVCGDGLQLETLIIFSLGPPVFVSGETKGRTVVPAVQTLG